jgi:hypothetical protein
MRVYSSTTVHKCECGTETHVFAECAENLKNQLRKPIICWRCDKVIATVPAIRIWTAATAHAVRSKRLTDMDVAAQASYGTQHH